MYIDFKWKGKGCPLIFLFLKATWIIKRIDCKFGGWRRPPTSKHNEKIKKNISHPRRQPTKSLCFRKWLNLKLHLVVILAYVGLHVSHTQFTYTAWQTTTNVFPRTKVVTSSPHFCCSFFTASGFRRWLRRRTSRAKLSRYILYALRQRQSPWFLPRQPTPTLALLTPPSPSIHLIKFFN